MNIDVYKNNPRETFLGLSFLLVSVAFIPNFIAPNFFDSNALPHFVLLLSVAIVLIIFSIIKKFKQRVNPGVLIIFSLVTISSFVSSLLSGNFDASLIGDTQRFNGELTLVSLMLVLVFSSKVSKSNFYYYLRYLTTGIYVVTFLGFLEQINLINLPGAGGAGSTLGNIDFLSAWIGTTIPICLLNFKKGNIRANFGNSVALGISLVVLLKLGVKQGYIDFLIAVFFTLIYFLRKKIQEFQIGPRTWLAVSLVLSLLFLEALLLIPFQKGHIPWISSDRNVKIRTEYWISALETFIHHPLFGVGADNYGNYYQQYRTVNSIRMEEMVVSNDPHSALFQILANFGLLGFLAFSAFFLFLAFKTLTSIFSRSESNKIFYFLTIFFVIYSANSMVSPITIPNKFIFYSLAGFVLGQGKSPILWGRSIIFDKFIKLRGRLNWQKIYVAICAPFLALILIYSSLFISSEIQIIRAINSLEKIDKRSEIKNFKFQRHLPCLFYYQTQNLIAGVNSEKKSVDFAIDEVQDNPRCIEARLYLAQFYSKIGYSGALAEQMQYLTKMAPANRAVLALVGDAANKWGDRSLLKLLHDQEVKLGYVK
jgi:O-antigen ligase